MLYATMLHVVAGVVTGSVFKVRALVLLLAFIIPESVILIASAGPAMWLWVLVNLVGIEIGYFAGMVIRGAVDEAYALPSAGSPKVP